MAAPHKPQPQPQPKLQHQLTLHEFYHDYILGTGDSVPIRYAAFCLGYRIHSVRRNVLWPNLYRVYIEDGISFIKCAHDEVITIVLKGKHS